MTADLSEFLGAIRLELSAGHSQKCTSIISGMSEQLLVMDKIEQL